MGNKVIDVSGTKHLYEVIQVRRVNKDTEIKKHEESKRDGRNTK